MVKLIYACVLTQDIDRMGAFYREVLQLDARSRGDVYLEFPTQPGIFSLWSTQDFEQFAGEGAAARVATGSVMLEFEIDNVDAEYVRLQTLDQLTIEFVMRPTTLPWGNRSIYFRDPDGNLINFFSKARSG